MYCGIHDTFLTSNRMCKSLVCNVCIHTIKIVKNVAAYDIGIKHLFMPKLVQSLLYCSDVLAYEVRKE